MYRIVPVMLALVGALCAADADFNGRWDIKVDPGLKTQRAWWMEIQGAGTPQIKGRFTGFPGGDTNDIEKPRIVDGALRFTSRRGNDRQEFVARLVGDHLEGERKSGAETLRFTAERSPTISEHDDGSWKPGQSVDLFNGRDLNGWTGRLPNRDLDWSVEDGVLQCTGKANDLVTDRKFWNFELHSEFRILPESNSGIALRGRYEVQILDDYGKQPNLHSNGSLYSRIAPAVNASKAAGEWQTFDIRLVGLDVSVTLNGRKLIDKGHIDGLTAMGFDPDEIKPGPIALQGDHGPVEFRRITITPLKR
jgi:hypothetical protein